LSVAVTWAANETTAPAELVASTSNGLAGTVKTGAIVSVIVT